MPPQRWLVVQPLPGIGDMIWHLQPIRALAQRAGGPVTLLAKPRSHADEIFAAEETIREVIWLDRNPKDSRGAHDGPAGLWRLVQTLRAGRFDAAWVLHNSTSVAFATWAAGIRCRHGYGIGTQRWFLNRGPWLPRGVWQSERPMQRATRFLAAANIPNADAEPRLSITPAARSAVQQRMAAVPGPMVALGIGSSEPMRQWGAPRFAALARTLLDAGWPCIALVGGPGEAAIAREITAALGNRADHLITALGWHLCETAALLAEAAFYAGNDTGVMNMAAAVGTRSYAIFGTTPALSHSALIVPILSPQGGPHDGAARVSLGVVVGAITRHRGSLAPPAPPSLP